jgi:hypothetical protein
MTDVMDERVRFYLRHREQIEAWAALKSEAAAAIDERLEQLVEDVEGLVGDLGDDVELSAVVQGEAYPRLLLHRKSWRQTEGSPEASVALEWARGKTLLGPTACPYVGVRFDISTERVRLLRNAFRDRVQPTRAARGDKATPWWPCLRNLPGSGEFWDDFQPYRQQLVDALEQAWVAYQDPLGQVLTAAEESSPTA